MIIKFNCSLIKQYIIFLSFMDIRSFLLNENCRNIELEHNIYANLYQAR